MRISDWSSDVCSSDLGAYFAVAAIFVALYLVRGGVFGQHGFEIEDFTKLDAAFIKRDRPVDDRVERQRAFAQARDHRVAARFDAFGEIGRASCRERVCQYVSISVVAVSLKKKKPRRNTNKCEHETKTKAKMRKKK